MPRARALLYAATALVMVFVGRAVLVAPPAFEVSVAFSVAYAALFLSGVFSLRLRMFADAVIAGPKGARGVALTFDDGPHPVHTRKVLDLLDAAGAKATFFVIARKAEAHPDVVRDIAARGHTVGLHSYAHDRLFSARAPSTIRKDLERGLAALESITGERPSLFRPPVGHTSPAIARVADELDLDVVGWSVTGRDGTAFARPPGVLARVRAGLCDGAIVLLHDAPERGERVPAGVIALPDVLAAIRERGLAVVPLASWLGGLSAPPAA